MIGYIGYITRSLSRNRLRFQLVTIGYTVTTNGYKLHNWLQILAHWLQVLNGLILTVTYRRTQQPRPHCPPLCVLSLLPVQERPPLMLRTAALDFVNVCQLIAAPISFLLPRNNSIMPTAAPFLKTSAKYTRADLVNLWSTFSSCGPSADLFFIGVGKTPRVSHIPSG